MKYIRRFARWLIRNEGATIHEVGDKVWTGYVSLLCVSQTYQEAINGDHEVTLRLVRKGTYYR